MTTFVDQTKNARKPRRHWAKDEKDQRPDSFQNFPNLDIAIILYQ